MQNSSMVLRYSVHSIHYPVELFAYWANRGREGFVGTMSMPLVRLRPSVSARLERRAKLACEKELPKGPVARVRCPNGVGKLEDLSEDSTFKTTTPATHFTFHLNNRPPQLPRALALLSTASSQSLAGLSSRFTSTWLSGPDFLFFFFFTVSRASPQTAPVDPRERAIFFHDTQHARPSPPEASPHLSLHLPILPPLHIESGKMVRLLPTAHRRQHAGTLAHHDRRKHWRVAEEAR